MNTRMKELSEKVKKFGAEHYKLQENEHKCPVVISKGKGVWVEDADGNKLLDACAGYSSVNLGHMNPEIDGLIRELLTPDKDGWGLPCVVPNSTPTEPYAEFVEYACVFLGADKMLAKNGGVESVDTAIKLMRKWGAVKKIRYVRHGNAEIVVCERNFHGRTIAAISASTNPEYRDPFGPLTPGFIPILYGDAQALERTLEEHPNVVGFLVEPIQGEGGVNIPHEGYLRKCYELCRKHDVVFCADEIQTGLGRTGKLLACSHEGVEPDIFILGKSLGGGRIPTSATFAKKDFMVFTPGEDGSTHGGNALAMSVARKVLEIIERDKLCERSAEMGEYLLGKLKHGLTRGPAKMLIKEVRGRGLMIGIDLAQGVNARAMITALLTHGVMTKDAHHVIRITPPLIIAKAECDELVKRILRTFRDVACEYEMCTCKKKTR